jgi:hypothetical protein
MSGGSTGELYLGRLDKTLLGVGNKIGSWSPVQELSPAYATQPSPKGQKVNIIGIAVDEPDSNIVGRQGD